jgi:hypothetical protein
MSYTFTYVVRERERERERKECRCYFARRIGFEPSNRRRVEVGKQLVSIKLLRIYPEWRERERERDLI